MFDRDRCRLTPFLEHAHTLAALWRLPRQPRATLERFQSRKLRVLIEHAYRCVPYYRELFDGAGIRPADIRSAADLQRLPITTKGHLRHRPLRDLVARGVDPDGLVLHYTGGSTGTPTQVRRTAREEHLLQTFRIRAQRMLGRRMRDRVAIAKSVGVAVDVHPLSLGPLKERLAMWRSEDVDCLRPIAEVAGDLARLEPDVVAGYPGVLTEVAAVWPQPPPPNPRLVFVGGEVMTPGMRARIRDGFGARVFDVYGSHEFNLLAWECAVTGELHVCDDNVIVEIQRAGGPAAPGEPGDVIVTGLHGYAVPFIRYSLGDTATRGESTCRCGAPFSTLRNVCGRTMDYCLLPDGRKMHPWEIIPMTFWERPWHRRYQLVQETRSRFALRLVADTDPPPGALDTLRSQVGRTLGPSAEFRIDLVDELALGPNGKQPLCRSYVTDEGSA